MKLYLILQVCGIQVQIWALGQFITGIATLLTTSLPNILTLSILGNDNVISDEQGFALGWDINW